MSFLSFFLSVVVTPRETYDSHEGCYLPRRVKSVDRVWEHVAPCGGKRHRHRTPVSNGVEWKLDGQASMDWNGNAYGWVLVKVRACVRRGVRSVKPPLLWLD